MYKLLYSIAFSIISLAGFSQTAEQDYLKKNMAKVKLDGTEMFSFLTKDFYDNQLFLFGENHGSSQPHQFDVAFFKHLYAKEDVRTYIAEVDGLKALMLNNYLKDGNEEWLVKVFKSWQQEGAQWANKANWNKYRQLHLFYKTLPVNKKFSIIGIDVIQDYSLVKEYFQLLLKNRASTIPSINKFVSIADTMQYKNRRILGQLAREIAAELTIDKRYAKELQQNYKAFDLFIKNAGYVGNGMTRDSIMFRTFNDAVTAYQLTNKKMYGFLGFFHTLQCKYEGMPFAGFLKQQDPNFKVVSLQMLALNSTVLLPYNDQLKKMMPAPYVAELRKKNPDFPVTERYIPYTLSNDDPMMKVDGIEDVKAITKENTVYVFKLTGLNTPYTTSKKLAEVSGFQALKMSNLTSVTTNAFQYIILFRNSAAALPVE